MTKRNRLKTHNRLLRTLVFFAECSVFRPRWHVSVANSGNPRRWAFDKARDSAVANGTKQSLMSRLPQPTRAAVLQAGVRAMSTEVLEGSKFLLQICCRPE
jgi:hypothetical protein